MGFSIQVRQKQLCPHCKLYIDGISEEVFYDQKSFFDDYWNNPRIEQMTKLLDIKETDDSYFSGEGQEALGILAKIESIVDPVRYRKIIKVLENPGTYMFASW